MVKKEERVPAIELLNKFLNENKITLTITPLQTGVKIVSDGSILISKPIVDAEYRD